MKSLWNLVSLVAVTHLFAVLLFAVWLWQSGRLDAQRVQAARALFATPIDDAAPASGGAASPGGGTTLSEAMSASRAGPAALPSASSAQIEFASRMEERAALATRRVAEEQHQLMAQLAARQTELLQAVARFEADKAAWEAAVRDEQQRRVDEQFLKAVRQLESIPPKQAKQVIEELVSGNAMDIAVSYLDAMDARAAKKLLSEFKAPAEIALATQLLERLRTLGTPAERRETIRDDQRAAADPEPESPDA